MSDEGTARRGQDKGQPEPQSPLLDPGTLAQLKTLSLRVDRVVDGILQGVHRSPHHGRSVEFAEHKDYTPGDDIRHIDWRAFARLDKVYVKRFEQETNLSAWFAIDASGSMAYGAPGGLTKHAYAATMLASLASLLLRQQDAVGLVSFDREVTKTVPVRGQLAHLKRITEVLETASPGGKTRLESGLVRIAEMTSKRGLIFVFSDFFGDAEVALNVMRQLVSKGHTVTVFHVLDGDELTFPFEGVVNFEGLEDGKRLLAEPRLVRDRYLAAMASHRETIRRRCLEAKIRHVPVDTREPLDRLLLSFLGSQSGSPERGASAR